MQAGILGTRAVYEALAMNGRMDVALAMLSKKDFPSYGYMVENPHEPSTTLWENWGAPPLLPIFPPFRAHFFSGRGGGGIIFQVYSFL